MADLYPVAFDGGDDAFENQPETAGGAYLQALNDVKLCDVVFTFEKCDDRIEAHQLFLRLRSPVFFDIFRGQGANVGKTREVQVTGITPQRFQEFLEFMYADKFEVNIAGALVLLDLGHEYQVSPLIKKCEELLKTDIKVEDSVQLFETATKHKNSELKLKAGDIMAKNIADISQKDDFVNVQEETLIYVLNRNDINIDEVDLFRLVVKWGQSRLNSAQDNSNHGELKRILMNLLPHVRFTNMTPREFTSEVVPSNLLLAQEMVNIYSYLFSDESNRKNVSALPNFSTTPRKSEEKSSLVRFYKKAITAARDAGANSLKECLSFFPVYEVQPDGLTQWNNCPRRPAIVGIIIHCPIDPARNLHTADFQLSIKCSDRTISDQSVVQKYGKRLTNCATGQETEIKIEPPVELNNGDNYCIAVEDTEENSFYRLCTTPSTCYTYEQISAGCSIPDENRSVSLKGFNFKLKAIQRNESLNGFSAANYSKINVIQGVRISLI